MKEFYTYLLFHLKQNLKVSFVKKASALVTFVFFCSTILYSQNVSILPGETSTIHSAKVYNSDFGPSNTGGSGFSCNFNRGRGIISIGAEIQSDGYASWDEIRVAFYYNGTWHEIYQFWMTEPTTTSCELTTDWNQSYYTQSNFACVFSNTNYETETITILGTPVNYPDRTKVGQTGGGFADRYTNIYLKNMGNLDVYHGNYLPMAGVKLNRVAPADRNMWGLQTAEYTATGEPYPCHNDPNPATKKSTGYDIGNVRRFGNLPGVIYNQYTPNIGCVILNIANLPPDMLDAPNFKVHIYAKSNGNNANRIYETTYSNQNFMTSSPSSLTATQDLCDTVRLTWSNVNNVLPDDGNVTIKNVIFRDGSYLAMIAGTATTYDDLTAVQNVVYDYTIRHVAFSETNETYYRSPATGVVEGQVQPRPDQPITPDATVDDCTGKIDIGWGFNGSNPTKFRIDTATSAAGPFATLSSVITGASRSYNLTGLQRGKDYYFRIYAINECNVLSTAYAECIGQSMADPSIATSVLATVNATYDTVAVSWVDNANNETKYQVHRQDDLGNLVIFDVNKTTGSGTAMTYYDNGITSCRSYDYSIKVFNECVNSGLISVTATTGALPPPGLGSTFDATKKLTCSKGYFSNRVELTWQNNNGSNIDIFKIYRKILGSVVDSSLVGTANAGGGFYVDNTADAGIYYKYTIVGIKYCNGVDIPSNTSEDLGYRSPTGVISGHVEYAGGIAVEDVQIIAEPTVPAPSYSANFSGGDYISIVSSASLESTTNSLALESYIRPTTITGGHNVIEKNGSYGLSLSATQLQFTVKVAGVLKTINYNLTGGIGGDILVNQYNHVAGVYDGSYVKLFVNGMPVDSVAATGTVDMLTDSVKIGRGFVGNIDEVRIFNSIRTNTDILRDYNRFLNGDEGGIVLLFHLDEGTYKYAFDISKTGTTFNANHGNVVPSNANVWSTVVPTQTQLGYRAFTNATGDYMLTGVRYYQAGTSYTITPVFGVHAFSPSTQVLFLGDQSFIQNGVDFTDISSFTVTGNVKYAPVTSTCPADGAFLLVDGNVVIQNGVPVTTDANGDFSIQVPIGNHFVSVSKNNHIYSAGRWPDSLTHDFQAPISGIQFIDSTFVKVIGRVVGGTRESGKPMIPGRSDNNIGQAKIKFKTLNGCFEDSVITDVVNGDYVIYLPPLKYTIPDFSQTNLGDPNYNTFLDPVFQSNALLDLINIPPVQTIKDTLYTNASGSTWSSVDSVDYQVIRSWTYRNNPTIWVKDTLGNDYLSVAGDSVMFYTDPVTKIVDTIPLSPKNIFGHPVYHERKSYTVDIGIEEVYQDLALITTDKVPVTTGDILINNGLAHYPVKLIDLADTLDYTSWNNDTCYFRYRFKGGNPSINFTTADPNNFTQQFGIQYTGGPNTATWDPNPGNTPFKGIVIGGKSSDGQSFVTLGPEVPTMILRDPPGSQSLTSLEVGETWVNTTSWSVEENLGATMEAEIELGTEFTTGIGLAVETDVENSLTLGAEIETTLTQEGGLQESFTTTQAWSTSSATDFVGSEGDVYIGKSMNITFGMSRNILMLKDSDCLLAGIECRTEPLLVGGQTYRVGKKVSLSAAPGGYATSFIYTQDHIVNTLLPRLERLRDQLFVMKPGTYLSYLTAGDPNYGKNNDNPAFGTSVSSPDPLISDLVDTNGVSYHYIVPSTPIIIPIKSALTGLIVSDTLPATMGDSIRWYNQQIRLWEQAIEMNEREKYEALLDANTLTQNYSFSSGIAYSNSAATESTSSNDFTFEVGVSRSMALAVGGSVGGTGVELETGLSVGLSAGGGYGKEHTSSTTFTFEFSDEDVGDFYSVDVRKSKLGFSPIFNIVAGESSCPWEGADSSLYFQNAGNSVVLSGGTLHRELAEMKVDGSPTYSEKLNIPSNSYATYILELINISESLDDMDYGIKVLSETNPDGAILSIDGYSPSTQIYPVASGSSINKTLVLNRGAIAYDYDSIAVVIYSLCDDPAVGDTVYVTAHFLPTCTNVDISSPLNQWVVNNSFNDTVPVVINDYDINFVGLQQIGFEFKPSAQSSWIGMQNWYRTVFTPGSDSLEISQSASTTYYEWSLTGLPDGDYDLRVNSTCLLANNESVVYSGVVDRINPHTFGTPSPADGILEPNDDIFIQFNEPVDIGSVNSYNFDVRGVLNGTNLRHSESLNFDGVADYAYVSGGANLKQRNFTVEFWAKLNATGINQTVMSQGNSAGQSLAIGFDANDKLSFRLGNQTVLSNTAVGTPTDWHHYAIAYSFDNSTVELFVDGVLENSGFVTIFFDYLGEGKLAFGKELPSNTNFFNGNIHEVRLWNTTRSLGEVASNLAVTLSRNELGLLYNWKMDEAEGIIASDDIRNRDADLFGPTWEVNPNGNALDLDGVDDYLTVQSGTIPITKEMDFTMEFWFNSNQAGAATLFSNGNGDGLQADSLISWNIEKDASGIIHVKHKGIDLIATNQNYFDGNWHHFALIMNRSANLSSYIDGNLQTSIQAIDFEEMASSNMFVGAHGYYTGTLFTADNFFAGKMDEFRFWNTARTVEQVRRDRINRLLGDEFALQAYLPFEDYALVLGVPVLTSSLNDNSNNALIVTDNGVVTLINQTPTIKLPRPVQAVTFNYSVNNDKIIITPTTSPELIENVTLDITVKNIKDLHGNSMQSPETWIAYINKNQVLWQDDLFSFTKSEDSVITFDATIINSGGAAKTFNIGGLPAWLTCSVTSGIIGPNSSTNVTFTISNGYSVGEYFADVTLTTDFGYDEILTVNLNVAGNPPVWNVDPTAFAYNMIVFGELEIDGIVSTNTGSVLAAFIDGTLCGVGNLEYLAAYDRYEVFLNVYNNNVTGDSVKFQIYDASTGYTFVDVTPSLMFTENDVFGTVINPITFQATSIIEYSIPLNNGWTWVSLPLESNQLNNSNELNADLTNANGDVIKGQFDFDQYDVSTDWLGGLSTNGGYLNAQSYKFSRTSEDTLYLVGERIHPDSSFAQINLQQGWNWIGYVSIKPSDINVALGQYTATTGDIIKSQYSFAYYDNAIGWVGSLTTMNPGYGYMFKAVNSGNFSYPLSLYYGKSSNNSVAKEFELGEDYEFQPEMYSKTMSVVAKSNLCAKVLKSNEVVLAAYDVNNNIRGFARPQLIGEEYYFFVTLYSNSYNDALSFKYINYVTKEEVSTVEGIDFASDDLVGKIGSPNQVNVEESLVCSLLSDNEPSSLKDASFNYFPNPFSDKIALEFSKSVNVSITITDVLGRTVFADKRADVINTNINGLGNLPRGIYTLKIKGDIDAIVKVVKQ